MRIARHQPRQRDLAGIGGAAEHAFAAEGTADLDAVEPADQRVILPAFYAVRAALAVQRDEARLDRAVDPGLLAAFGGLRAHRDDTRQRRGCR